MRNPRKYTDEFLIEELLRVANLLGVSHVSHTGFNKNSPIAFTTLAQRFGSWKQAHKIAGLDEEPLPKPIKYSDEFLIKELLRVAELLGKKSVSTSEFDANSLLGNATYLRRFGTWTKACEKAGLEPWRTTNSPYTRHSVPREIRASILKRDFYKCCICGASPATDTLVDLEIDHIKPIAKGGTNHESNLWTLCALCNNRKGTQYDIEIALRAHKHKLVIENVREEDKSRVRKVPPKPRFKACNLTPDIEPIL